MDNIPPSLHSISWNGLTLSPPSSWETIIGAERHLIFESELRPTLELRWEPGRGIPPGQRQRDRILSQLYAENNASPALVDIPDYLNLAETSFELQAFGTSNSTDGVLITCRRCGTLVLAKFHSKLRDRALFTTFFSGFECQHQDKGAAHWAIQDISFTVPGGFDLQRYGITFGMSSFSFAGRHSQLHLCRLAPASEHFKQSGFADLFRIFSKAEPGDAITEDSGILSYCHNPRFLERITARLRRRYSFRQSSFKHVEERDRVLGFRLESYRPIQLEMVQMIQENYDLVQEKT